jgi:hypothetical protein
MGLCVEKCKVSETYVGKSVRNAQIYVGKNVIQNFDEWMNGCNSSIHQKSLFHFR